MFQKVTLLIVLYFTLSFGIVQEIPDSVMTNDIELTNLTAELNCGDTVTYFDGGHFVKVLKDSLLSGTSTDSARAAWKADTLMSLSDSLDALRELIQFAVDSSKGGTYGSIHSHDDNHVFTIPAGDSYTKINSFDQKGGSLGVVLDTTNDALVFLRNGLYYAKAYASIQVGIVNINYKPVLFLNETELDETHEDIKFFSINSKYSLRAGGHILVTDAPDTLTVRVRHNGGTDQSVTVTYSHLLAHAISNSDTITLADSARVAHEAVYSDTSSNLSADSLGLRTLHLYGLQPGTFGDSCIILNDGVPAIISASSYRTMIGAEPAFGTGTALQYRRGDDTWATLNYSAILGLSDTTTKYKSHLELDDLNTSEYTHITGDQKNGLVSGSNTTLHYHSSDRDRGNHSGTQAISTVAGLQPELDLKSNTTHLHTGIYEPVIAAGSSNQYWTGDKQWTTGELNIDTGIVADCDALFGRDIQGRVSMGAVNSPGSYFSIVNLHPYLGSSEKYDIQLASRYGGSNEYYLRSKHDTPDTAKPWVEIYTSGNLPGVAAGWMSDSLNNRIDGETNHVPIFTDNNGLIPSSIVCSGDDVSFAGDLDMTDGNISNISTIEFDAATNYIIKLKDDGNTGVYFDVSSNIWHWKMNGDTKSYIDLDNGNFQCDGDIDANGNVDISGTLSGHDVAHLYSSLEVDGLLNADGGADIEGDVDISGNLLVGGSSVDDDRVVRVLSNDSHIAGFEAYGDAQGTGYIYVGQNSSNGGGMFYNGDGAPEFAPDEEIDKVTFYRKYAGVNYPVFSYSPVNSDVSFVGSVDIEGDVDMHNDVDIGGDLLVGGSSVDDDRVVRVLSNDSHIAGFEAYGDAQGTGYIYVGQNSSNGGGMFYNGDGAPEFAPDEEIDKVTFYRKYAGVNYPVFSYSPVNSDVSFVGSVDIEGDVDMHNDVDIGGDLLVDGDITTNGVIHANSKIDISSTPCNVVSHDTGASTSYAKNGSGLGMFAYNNSSNELFAAAITGKSTIDEWGDDGGEVAVWYNVIGGPMAKGFSASQWEASVYTQGNFSVTSDTLKESGVIYAAENLATNRDIVFDDNTDSVRYIKINTANNHDGKSIIITASSDSGIDRSGSLRIDGYNVSREVPALGGTEVLTGAVELSSAQGYDPTKSTRLSVTPTTASFWFDNARTTGVTTGEYYNDRVAIGANSESGLAIKHLGHDGGIYIDHDTVDIAGSYKKSTSICTVKTTTGAVLLTASVSVVSHGGIKNIKIGDIAYSGASASPYQISFQTGVFSTVSTCEHFVYTDGFGNPNSIIATKPSGSNTFTLAKTSGYQLSTTPTFTILTNVITIIQ